MGASMNEVEDVLAHYGVMGMKWGVRKGDTTYANASAKTIAKADKKWEKGAGSTKEFKAAYNAGADRINAKNDAFNNSWEKSGKRFGNQEYFNAFSKFAEKEFQKAADDHYGTNASQTKKVKVNYSMEAGFPTYTIVANEVRHTSESVVFVGITDDSGRITRLKEKDDAVTHSGAVENFLAHYGVKGMKWGVRTKGSDGRNTSARAQIKEARGQAVSKVTSARKKAEAAENHAKAVYKQERDKNRQAGMGRLKAGRAALDSKASQKAERDLDKASDALMKTHKEANAMLKTQVANIRKDKLMFANQTRGEKVANVIVFSPAGAMARNQVGKHQNTAVGSKLAKIMTWDPVTGTDRISVYSKR